MAMHDPQPPVEDTETGETPSAPLLVLAEGIPPVTDSPEALAAVCARIDGGTGPVAIDAERASGYRYSARAYLVQLRREGAGTALVDPVAFDDLSPLAQSLAGTEWILHAASQDLPCLNELGLAPARVFDTELAGRLLGYPRVGLATLVETVLGHRLRKEHSAVDWSRRPLPEPWLEYAALDVEPLLDLRVRLRRELDEAGKADWAAQEFAYLLTHDRVPREDPWRRTSGLHKVRGRRELAAVRSLWQARDRIARERDVTPGRVLPDQAIVAAALVLPRSRRGLRETKGFRGRGAQRHAPVWVQAVAEARALPESELPPLAARYDGPPPARSWPDRDPAAAKRLQQARTALAALAEHHHLPAENLLTPDHVRRVLWDPPASGPDTDPGRLAELVGALLRDLGARPWQIEQTREPLAEAIAAFPS